ncbi:hypothetical protein M0804_004695 [Polistes exclamans]|nr:hypothetical protein M0804_004695 [Polistes exclamans]
MPLVTSVPSFAVRKLYDAAANDLGLPTTLLCLFKQSLVSLADDALPNGRVNAFQVCSYLYPNCVCDYRYYGSGGMGGGGGLQATDLRRRLESQSCERNFFENPPSLRQEEDGFYVPVENDTCEDEDKVEFGAILVSGQPTCTGSRAYKRQEKEEDTEEIRILRRVIGSDGSFHGKLRFSTKSFDSIENEAEATTQGEGEGERKQRLRWCRRDFRRIAEVATRTLLLGIVLLVTPGLCHQDAVHITAILGESVVFNCHVEFPGEHPVPYVLQWEKKVGDKAFIVLQHF